MKQSGLMPAIKFLMKNFIDIVTVFAAGYVVIRHQIVPFETNELIGWLLAILTLIAISGLWERSQRLTKIENVTQANYDLTLKEYGARAKARNFFLEDSDLLHHLTKDKLEDARQIYLSGMSLRRTIRTLQPILEQKITTGVEVKIIILDRTDQNLMEELVLRSAGSRTAIGWQEALKGTHDDIQTIIEGLPKNAKGTIEIGYLPYIPSFGTALINPKGRNQNDKACFVELYHHRSTLINPTFAIEYKGDEAWFRFFAAQYELLWKSCKGIEKYPS